MRIIVFLFFFAASTVFAQEQSVKQVKDSIVYYLDNANGKKSIPYASRALYLSKTIQSDSLLKESSKKLGYRGYSFSNREALKEANKNLLVLFEKNKDSFSLAKYYHFKALIFRLENSLDSSYYYYNKSKDISVLLKDSLQVGIRLKSMGHMQLNENDYVGAQPTLIAAIEVLEPLDNITYRADCYNLLGSTLTNLNQFEQARKYLQQSLDVISKSDSDELKKRWKIMILNAVAYSYFAEKNYTKSLEIIEEGMKYPDLKTKYTSTYKLLLETSASIKNNLGRKEEALSDYLTLLEIRKKDNNLFRLSRTYFNLAEFYFSQGLNQEALINIQKSYDLSSQTNNNFIKQLSLEMLSNLTSGQEAKTYFQEYIELRNELEKRSANLKQQFALVRFETEKKEQENVALKVEAENERQQKIISWLVSLAAILGLGLSINFFRTRRKKLIYQSQLQKAAAREEERQQIAKSLHDEVAGDLRIIHQKLSKSALTEEAQNIEKVKNNVRNLSHQLSSVSFDEVSFKDQIINLISDHFSSDFKIKVSGLDLISWKDVNETIKRTLYLGIRESLQNTLKYANANQFLIEFSGDKKEIVLHLKDNGEGFDILKGKKGIGLKNLKERIEEIQGSFQIESSKEGTQTTLKIPINGK